MGGGAGGDWIDRATLDETLEALGDDVDLLERLAITAVENCGRLVDQLREAATRADPEVQMRAAHALRGTAGQYGATVVGRLAEAIEREAGHGRVTAGDDLAAMVEAWAGTDRALKAYIDEHRSR